MINIESVPFSLPLPYAPPNISFIRWFQVKVCGVRAIFIYALWSLLTVMTSTSHRLVSVVHVCNFPVRKGETTNCLLYTSHLDICFVDWSFYTDTS